VTRKCIGSFVSQAVQNTVKPFLLSIRPLGAIKSMGCFEQPQTARAAIGSATDIPELVSTARWAIACDDASLMRTTRP
jgi:hypothetical protein